MLKSVHSIFVSNRVRGDQSGTKMDAYGIVAKDSLDEQFEVSLKPFGRYPLNTKNERILL